MKTRQKSDSKKPQDQPTVWASDIHLSQRYEVSRKTIWGWAKKGLIPAPVKIGPNCTRWHLPSVIEALEVAA